MNKLALLTTTSILLVSFIAHAGKEERSYMNDSLMPAVKTAEATFRKACGCPIVIKLNAATVENSLDDMGEAKNIAQSVTESAPKHCTDAPSKKAVCAMKTLEIAKAKTTAFTYKNGAGLATTDGQSYSTFEMMVAELDK